MEIPMSKILEIRPNTELYLVLGLSKYDNGSVKISYEVVLRLIYDIEKTYPAIKKYIGNINCIRPIKAYTTIIPGDSICCSLNMNSLPRHLEICQNHKKEFEKSSDEMFISKKLFSEEFHRNLITLYEQLAPTAEENFKFTFIVLPHKDAQRSMNLIQQIRTPIINGKIVQPKEFAELIKSGKYDKLLKQCEQQEKLGEIASSKSRSFIYHDEETNMQLVESSHRDFWIKMGYVEISEEEAGKKPEFIMIADLL